MSYKYLGSSSAAPGSGSGGGDGSYLALDANNNLILTASSGGGGGGGGTPGGSTTQVQFNDGGSFGGSGNLTFNGTTLTGSYTGSLAELTTLSASNALITGSGKLYFNDTGGEYISGDGNNLTAVAGTNIIANAGTSVALIAGTAVHVAAPALQVSSSGSPYFNLLQGDGAANVSLINWQSGSTSDASGYLTKWADGVSSNAYVGNPALYNSRLFTQVRNKDSDVAVNYIQMALSNSGSLYIGRGTGGTGSITDFYPSQIDDYAYAAYIGTTDANTGGALYASGSVKVKGDLSASSMTLAPTSGSLAGAGSYLGLDVNNQIILTSSAGGGGGGVITALNNQAESRLVSIGSTTTELDGEANLTFDGTNLILTGAFNQSLVALSFVAGTASVNGAASNMFSATVTGSEHLANPTNLLPGASYTFILTQDGTGGRTLSFGTSYLWPGGITGSLSTGANDVDILSAITDGTSLYCSLTKDFS